MIKRPMLESFTVRNEHGFAAAQVDANNDVHFRVASYGKGEQTISVPRSMLPVLCEAFQLLMKDFPS